MPKKMWLCAMFSGEKQQPVYCERMRKFLNVKGVIMAEVKKATAKVVAKAAPVKEEVKKAEVKEAPKAVEVKAEVKEAPKAAAKAEEKKAAPAKKETAKAAAKKAPAKKPAAKKEAAKPAAKKAPAKKAAVTEVVNFQFSGKSYTSDDLLKICKDVWKYDLNGKEEDFKSVELYVKPEENTTYYVINGDITGSFFI